MLALSGHCRRVLALAYTPDGGTLVSGGFDGSLRVWDPASGDALASITTGFPFIYDLAFHPNGTLVLANGRRELAWVDAASFKPGGTWTAVSIPTAGHSPRAVSVSAERGSLLTVGHDGPYETGLDYWTTSECSTFHRRFTTTTPRNDFPGVSISRDGHIAALVSTGGECWVLDSLDQEQGRALRLPRTTHGHARHIKLSGDARRLAVVAGSIVELWSLHEGELAPPATKRSAVLAGHEMPIWSVAFSPDGMILATASMDGTLRLWDPYDGAELACIDPGVGRLYSVAFDPGGQTLAVAGHNGDIYLIDVDLRR